MGGGVVSHRRVAGRVLHLGLHARARGGSIAVQADHLVVAHAIDVGDRHSQPSQRMEPESETWPPPSG